MSSSIMAYEQGRHKAEERAQPAVVEIRHMSAAYPVLTSDLVSMRNGAGLQEPVARTHHQAVSNTRFLEKISQLVIPLIVPDDEVVFLNVKVVDHWHRQLPESSAIVTIAGVQARELAEVICNRSFPVNVGKR